MVTPSAEGILSQCVEHKPARGAGYFGDPPSPGRCAFLLCGHEDPVGFQKSTHPWCAAVSRGPFVLVDQATQNWSKLDVFMAEVGGGVGQLGWAKIAGVVGSSNVVVANVLREHYTQVPLTEDQHSVGELGSESAYEPFGETVRPWATRRNPDHLDAHIGENGIERCSELADPIPDEELESSDAIAEVHHEAADLLCGP